jgi:hypothetical protein
LHTFLSPCARTREKRQSCLRPGTTLPERANFMDESLPTAKVGALQAPPPGVPGGLMWRLAWRLAADHVEGADGFCVACRPHQTFPCPARYLAAEGFRAARGRYAGLRHLMAAGRAVVRGRGAAW